MRTSFTMFPSVWRANTQIQIHKYTYTGLVKVADWPNMCYIFENVMVRGLQKQCSQVSDVRIHRYKYTTSHKYIWFLVLLLKQAVERLCYTTEAAGSRKSLCHKEGGCVSDGNQCLLYMVKIPYMEAGIVIMTDFSIVEKQKSANLGFCPNDGGRGSS